jgi:hypothetical protein
MTCMRSIVACIIIVLFASAGCRDRERPTQGQAFYFYPRANVYYDIEQKEYYRFDSISNGWQRSSSLDPAVETGLGRRVMIDTPRVPVYIDNARHRLVYSAALYASPEVLRQKFIEDSLKSLPPHQPVDSTLPLPTKKRSGIRRFFDKVFGHKEKPAAKPAQTDTRE